MTKTAGVARHAGRGTRRWKTIPKTFRAEAEAKRYPCWLCQRSIDYDTDDKHDDNVFEPDHVYPVADYPERAVDITNLRASDRACTGAASTTSPRPASESSAGHGDP